jgi:hypothetical protein
MTQTLTEKQRVAIEALEGARRAGVPLSDYAKANGLEDALKANPSRAVTATRRQPGGDLLTNLPSR